MAEHKHAEVLRAIADGVPLSEFEMKWRGPNWMCLSQSESFDWIWETPNEWEIRRKPQHILVNGFKVPKPLDVAPENTYFCASPETEDFYDELDWDGIKQEKRWLERGILHATKEAEIAHAKAMLGIDPEAA